MSGGDYGGFKTILEDARQDERELRQQPEVACPVCGEPLDFNPRGIGNCPAGHYRQHTTGGLASTR